MTFLPDFGDTNTRILLFILAFHRQHGRGPKVREVGCAVDLLSTSHVHAHLKRLKRAGLIDWEEGRQGTLHPTCRRVA